MNNNKIIQHHLVMTPDLNHLGTLFGGAAMALADANAVICATLAYPNASFVTKHFEPFNFLAPAKIGDILEITCEITGKGNTSVCVSVTAENTKTREKIFSTSAVFVNVVKGEKKPLDYKP